MSLDLWNLPKYLCMYESFFVGHINIMRAPFKGSFCFRLQQTYQLEIGQLESLVVHLLFFRGYEQHILIGRPLHLQAWTQGREAPSWKVVGLFGQSPKERRWLATWSRRMWSACIISKFLKIGNPLIIWWLFQMIYELWCSQILRQYLFLWWFCSNPDLILQTTMVKDDIWKCHQVMYLHY